jgi:hypothetical protein
MKHIKELALEVPCIKCDAKVNRKCLRVVGLDAGTALEGPHPQRKHDYFQKVMKGCRKIKDVPFHELRTKTLVRSLNTGLVGKISRVYHGYDDVCINWEDGNQTVRPHDELDFVVEWKENEKTS